MAKEEYFFKTSYNCDDDHGKLAESGHSRIKSIIKYSRMYEDELHKQLEQKLQADPKLIIKCHRDCVSTYTSKSHASRYLKRHKKDVPPSQVPHKKRRSTLTSFNFQQECIYCGEFCDLKKDVKNPARWRPAYLCREIDCTGERKPLKQAILQACDDRNDEWAACVRVRVSGAISDLHAADARYHVDCRSKFMSTKSIASAANSSTHAEEMEEAFDSLIRNVQADKSRIWNSVDLFTVYKDFGGNMLSRRTLIKKLSDYFGSDFVVLSCVGIASVIVFRSEAANTLRLVDVEEDDMDADV